MVMSPVSLLGIRKSGVSLPSVGSQTIVPPIVIISPRKGMQSFTLIPNAPRPIEYSVLENLLESISSSHNRAYSTFEMSPATFNTASFLEASKTVNRAPNLLYLGKRSQSTFDLLIASKVIQLLIASSFEE